MKTINQLNYIPYIKYEGAFYFGWDLCTYSRHYARNKDMFHLSIRLPDPLWMINKFSSNFGFIKIGRNALSVTHSFSIRIDVFSVFNSVWE